MGDRLSKLLPHQGKAEMHQTVHLRIPLEREVDAPVRIIPSQPGRYCYDPYRRIYASLYANVSSYQSASPLISQVV